jgi:hypothetical protein
VSVIGARYVDADLSHEVWLLHVSGSIEHSVRNLIS